MSSDAELQGKSALKALMARARPAFDGRRVEAVNVQFVADFF